MTIPKNGTRTATQYVYSVSELTREIKILLETSLSALWVEGEISNFKLHSSGHMYFSLKDETAQINCTMWRSRNQALLFKPQDGMKVQVYGQVTVYEKRGGYQLDIIQIRPTGIGDLQIAFELLKRKLRDEGLFDANRKKRLPPYPERIGIVTSPTGAAIRDLVTVIRRRFPSVEIILRPALVQGDGAAEDIARAIEEFNEFAEIDVLIVGRGGGSLEDLWAFNEEVVARAIANSRIPIISAVGHEVDFSISDFVADLRAPTPSAAAELVVKEKDALLQNIRSILTKIYRNCSNRITNYKNQLNYLQSGYGFRRPADITRQFQQRLDELIHNMEIAQQHRMDLARQQLEFLIRQLHSLGPESVLARGYSICFREADGQPIKSGEQLQKSDMVRLQFGHGAARGAVEELFPEDNLDDTIRKLPGNE